MNVSPTAPVVLAFADDEAWVRFVVGCLELDGREVRTIRCGEPLGIVGTLLVVVTTASRDRVEGWLRHVPEDLAVVPLLREGAPDAAVPGLLRDRPYVDLRDDAPRVGELGRLWCLVEGREPPEPRPSLAEIERHLAELARREGPTVAGWSAAVWGQEAHDSDDHLAEWELRRLAGDWLRGGGAVEDALVQYRHGLAAALVANSPRGIVALDERIIELEPPG